MNCIKRGPGREMAGWDTVVEVEHAYAIAPGFALKKFFISMPFG
jgi:hypothetical protein